MPVITVEKPLRDKLGDEAVDSLVRLINQSRTDQKKEILEFVEEKFERRLSEEISDLKVTFMEKISETKEELKALVSETRVELTRLVSDSRSENAKAKADLIKWMFIFWVGQVSVILGILFTFFKK